MHEIGTFKVDDTSGIPVWIQVRKRLVYLIVSGRYQEGEKLPTVRELAVALDINYNTVNKVYQDLERDGFIETKRGRGSFVADLSKSNLVTIDNEVTLLADQFVSKAADSGMVEDEMVSLVRTQAALHRGEGRRPDRSAASSRNDAADEAKTTYDDTDEDEPGSSETTGQSKRARPSGDSTRTGASNRKGHVRKVG